MTTFKRTLLISLLSITLLFVGLQLFWILRPLFILDPEIKYVQLINQYQNLKMERLVLEEKYALTKIKNKFALNEAFSQKRSFLPEQTYLRFNFAHSKREPIALSLAESKTFEQLEAYVSDSKPLQPKALTSDEKSILESSPDDFTLQLMGVRDTNELKKYIDNNHLQNARIIHTYYLNKDWYVLVSGLYKNHTEALKAIDTLPEEIKNHKPWIRQISSLQKAIQIYHK
jgi:SPOR domain